MTFAGMCAPVAVMFAVLFGPLHAPGGKEGPARIYEPVPRPAPSSDSTPGANGPPAQKAIASLTREQLPKPLPGPETRSPDDFELFLEGIVQAPRGPGAASAGCYVPTSRTGPASSLCAGIGGCANGACNQAQRIPYAPVHVSPTMQWAVPYTLPSGPPAAQQPGPRQPPR
jgi:hypothetical protein